LDTNLYLKYKGQFPKNSEIFISMFIDLIAFHLIIFILLKIYASIAHGFMDKYSVGTLGFIIYCISLFIIPILSSKARTLGQIMTKTKIQSVSGENLPIIKAIIRWIYSIFSPVGYSQKPVPWYDLKTGAVLIKTK